MNIFEETNPHPKTIQNPTRLNHQLTNSLFFLGVLWGLGVFSETLKTSRCIQSPKPSAKGKALAESGQRPVHRLEEDHGEELPNEARWEGESRSFGMSC